MSADVDDDFDDGVGLDDDLDLPIDLLTGIFAGNYSKLRALGWSGVLWLPEGQKSPPLGRNELPFKRSLTGYGATDCDVSELHLLASSTLRRGRTGRGRGFSGARGNIAVRAPQHVIKDGTAYDLIFLDVDDYAKGDETKTGAATVTAIEEAAGARFPATFKITSRGDSVSGKYAYLIPPETKLVSSRPDVELVQWWHRYAVAPPSINRSSNGTIVAAYSHAAPRAGECAGELLDGMFRPEQAAVMPAELVEELTDKAGFQNGGTASEPQVRAFLDELPVDPTNPQHMCKATTNALDRGVAEMRQHGSAFEATRTAIMRLLRLGHQRHVGVPAAFAELEQAYSDTQRAPGDNVHKASAEVQRMIHNARGIGLILNNATPEEDRGRRCVLVLTDDEILSILETGGEGMGVTLDEVRDIVGSDRWDDLVARFETPANGTAPVGPTAAVAEAPARAAVAVAPRPVADLLVVAADGAPPQEHPEAPLQPPLRLEGRLGPMPPLFDGAYTNDDVGNGRRFVAVWGDDVAWVPDAKLTYTWTGTRWEADTGAQMRHLTERLTDFMLAEAKLRLRPAQQRVDALAHHPPEHPGRRAAEAALVAAKADLNWTGKSRMDKPLRACITSAVSHPGMAVHSGQWDSHKRLLNLSNGALRLELDGTHTFYDHQREDRLTQQAAVAYDPEAVAVLFLRALERWLPDPKDRRVVRALAGLALVGDNAGHLFPVFIGETRSGKTTLAELIAAVLDNPDNPGIAYSGSFELNDLRPKTGSGPNAKLFRLARRRWVYCSEAHDGGPPLSADLMKRFSGGDRQGARDTYGKAGSIDDRPPAFLPVLATNKTPQVEGADTALRERVIAVWFGHTIPRPERDKQLQDKLVPEHPGVLNWALEGYRDVMQNPSVLTDLPAECVDKATEMFQAMSIYERWKAEETVPSDDKTEWIQVDDSWHQFRTWCISQNEKPDTKHKFGTELAALGHPSRSSGSPHRPSRTSAPAARPPGSAWGWPGARPTTSASRRRRRRTRRPRTPTAVTSPTTAKRFAVRNGGRSSRGGRRSR